MNDLETSIEKYSEAMKMIKICSDKLNKATESVNKILEENGNLSDFTINEQKTEKNSVFLFYKT